MLLFAVMMLGVSPSGSGGLPGVSGSNIGFSFYFTCVYGGSIFGRDCVKKPKMWHLAHRKGAPGARNMVL